MYDAIIIGAGHNGLVTAAYLARAGVRVLVLERREQPGGTLVTETFGDGLTVDSVHAGGALRPDIIKDLNLSSFGYPVTSARSNLINQLSPTDRLVLSADPVMSSEAIKRFSEKDAGRWPEFTDFMNRAAEFLDLVYATPMPRLPKNINVSEGFGLFEILLDLRLMGRRDMHAIIRMLPMSAVEFLDEWFESEVLKAALASIAIHHNTLGVMSPGSGFTLLHNWLNRGGLAHNHVGQAGEITAALARAVTAYGGEIRMNANAAHIRVDTYTCKGVVLDSGEEIDANTVISAIDPKRTFLELVGALNLPPEFVWNVQSIKMRGSTARMHLLLDRPLGAQQPVNVGQEQTTPHGGTIVFAPSVTILERAFDASKYGLISEHPHLEITTRGKTASITMQYAPFKLRNESWQDHRTQLEELILTTLEEQFPKLRASIVKQVSLTPQDLETTYGLTEGDPNHGQLMLDQILFMRPIPGWSDHNTPIDGLFLSGSGVHGGGGVSGASGRNAARIISRNIKRNRLK
jgi:phytoene dehydrogenase-like protein